MAVIGYARGEQDLELQITTLKASGCKIVRIEGRSLKTASGRADLSEVVDRLRSGDTLIVTRLECLARSISALQTIVRSIGAKGAYLKVLSQRIDTTTSAETSFLNMLDVFAEFEASLHRERQAAATAKAKAGTYRGRPRSVDVSAVRRLKNDGLRTSEIAKRLGVSRSTVYRAARI